MSEQTQLVAKPHYPLVARLAIELFNAGELPEVERLEIEPAYGHVGRIVYRSGAVRMFRNARVGVNSDGATEIARDKGYTKHFLQLLGYSTPRGKVFMLPAFLRQVRANLGRYDVGDLPGSEQVLGYIDAEIGYPCYLKPHDESQGRGVSRCDDRAQVLAVLAEFQAQLRNHILVEAAVAMPDYRVVIFDGALIACYRREPLSIVGDGRATIRALLERRLAELLAGGGKARFDLNDARIAQRLQREGRDLDTVLPAGQPCQVFDIANLSAGGSAYDATAQLHQRWRDLCASIAADFGLRLCGVDLACPDIADPSAPYSIIELNSAPGLDNYAALGAEQAARVRDLYRRVLGEEPAADTQRIIG